MKINLGSVLLVSTLSLVLVGQASAEVTSQPTMPTMQAGSMETPSVCKRTLPDHHRCVKGTAKEHPFISCLCCATKPDLRHPLKCGGPSTNPRHL